MNEKSFNPEMSVAQVLKTWPKTIPVFLRLRTACVGCSMAQFDTLADVSRNYGIPIEQLLNELAENLQDQLLANAI